MKNLLTLIRQVGGARDEYSSSCWALVYGFGFMVGEVNLQQGLCSIQHLESFASIVPAKMSIRMIIMPFKKSLKYAIEVVCVCVWSSTALLFASLASVFITW